MWIFLGILSAFFASLVAILGKLGLKGLDSTMATTIRAIIMAIFLFLLSFGLGRFNNFKLADLSGRDWWLIIGSGIFGALSWLAYFAALKQGSATMVSALDRLSIVFIAILAIIFLGEQLTWSKGIGIMLILGGLIIATWK